jgi:hypothetical protein
MPVRSRTVALVAAVMALLLLPQPVAGDEQDELDKTRRRLARSRRCWARARLATATAELGAARRRQADALVALRRLEVARKRAVQLHDRMVEAEQDRTAAEAGWPGWPGPPPPCGTARPSCGA